MGKVLPLSKILETRENKQILSDSLVEPAEIVLKNNIFEFDKKNSQTHMGNRYWNEVCAFSCYSFYG